MLIKHIEKFIPGGLELIDLCTGQPISGIGFNGIQGGEYGVQMAFDYGALHPVIEGSGANGVDALDTQLRRRVEVVDAFGIPSLFLEWVHG